MRVTATQCPGVTGSWWVPAIQIRAARGAGALKNPEAAAFGFARGSGEANLDAESTRQLKLIRPRVCAPVPPKSDDEDERGG